MDPFSLPSLRALFPLADRATLPGVVAPVRAGVAVVLKDGPAGAEVLLIRRAEREGDPWSGHMALPGGRMDEADRTIERTAAREMHEEVGLDIEAGGRRLGRLDDLQAMAHGRVLPMAITPVAFELDAPEPPPLTLDAREVTEALWVPLEALASGRLDDRMTWKVGSVVPLRLKCWRYEGRVIWGLTYRMLRAFLRRVSARAVP